MSNITVKMQDGQERKFVDEARITNTLTFEGAFAVVTDSYGNRWCYPASNIVEIKERSRR